MRARHEHAVGRVSEEQGDDRQRIGARSISRRTVSATKNSSKAGAEASARSRSPALRIDAADQGRSSRIRPGDRQIDQPRPVDVRAVGGFSGTAEGRTSPARRAAREPGSSADCRRYRQREKSDRVPAVDHEIDAESQPENDDNPFPVRSMNSRMRSKPASFKGFPAVAGRGYRASGHHRRCSQPFIPTAAAFIGQLARFAISGAFVTALGVGVYALVALVLRWHPQLGNFLAYVVAWRPAMSCTASGASATTAASGPTHQDALRDRVADQLRAQQLLGVAAVHHLHLGTARRRSCRCCSSRRR
jgi:hypothetical protein